MSTSARRTIRRHQGQVPARPRRLRLRRQIRHARLSRRRPLSRRARPRRGSPPAPSRARSSRGVTVRGALVQMGKLGSTARAGTGTRSRAIRSSARTPRRGRRFADYLDAIRKARLLGRRGDRGRRRRRAGRLGRADLRQARRANSPRALMSINAVKGVEIGAGFAAAELTGEDNADEMRAGQRRRPLFLSNHAGGILGGISTGQPIVARFAVKPTSSILTPRRTVTATAARRPRSSPRAATTPASASAPCRSARRWWPACSPTLLCGIAARSATPRHGRSRPGG